MKRGLLCIAAALVLAAGALWLASLRNYDAADAWRKTVSCST